MSAAIAMRVSADAVMRRWADARVSRLEQAKGAVLAPFFMSSRLWVRVYWRACVLRAGAALERAEQRGKGDMGLMRQFKRLGRGHLAF